MSQIDAVGELSFFAQFEEPGMPTWRAIDGSHVGVLTPRDFANSIQILGKFQ